MSEHTPGPWTYRPQEMDDWGWVRAEDFQLVACARAGKGLSHADRDAHREAGTDPYEANARLIAAAPDMLAALQLVRGIIVEAAETGFNPHSGDWATRLFESQAVSHRAVRKATDHTKGEG